MKLFKTISLVLMLLVYPDIIFAQNTGQTNFNDGLQRMYKELGDNMNLMPSYKETIVTSHGNFDNTVIMNSIASIHAILKNLRYTCALISGGPDDAITNATLMRYNQVDSNLANYELDFARTYAQFGKFNKAKDIYKDILLNYQEEQLKGFGKLAEIELQDLKGK